MTVDEFDIRFDILYNNIASNAAPALTPYEKSVFLSQAQKEIITEVYTGKNNLGISFESTEEARNYLRGLTKSSTISNFETLETSTLNTEYKEYYIDVTNESLKDMWFITYEKCKIKDITDDILVVPTKQDVLFNTLNNPFKKPSLNKVLRVDADNKIYLYSAKDIEKYTIMYISKPTPIILNNINDGTLTIDGQKCSTPSAGNSPEILHSLILERAVELAKKTYSIN